MPYRAEAILSALIESTEDFVWSVDRSFGLLTFNRALRQHNEASFGITPQVGMSPEQLLPPQIAANWPPLYARAMAEGTIRTDYRFVNGRILELTLAPILINGKPTGVSVFGKDVTEKRIAERALLEAEKRNREVFDQALEGMLQTTPQGKYLSVNPALARMLGYDSPADLVAHVTDSARDVWLDPEERAAYVGLIEKQGSVRAFECRLKRKDGSVLWASFNCQKVYAADGSTRYYEGFVDDISARKRAQAEIRNSEERYRSTFEQAAVGILHVSFDGRVLGCNPRFADIIGYPSEEVPGKNLSDLTPPEYLPETLERVRQIAMGVAGSSSWEKPYLRKDRSLTWVRLTASVQYDGEGRPLHHIVFVEDINQRKAAEDRLNDTVKALQTSEERYRTLFQTSLDAISVSHLADGRYIDVNQAYLDMIGMKREDVMGKTSVELGLFVNPEDREDMVQALRQVSSFRDRKLRFKRKDGSFYSVLLSASTIEIDGVTCLVGVLRDLSEAEAAEDEIRNLAFYDPLTRLPNRRLLMDRLHQSIAENARTSREKALLLLDLDDFKNLNDSLGDPIGDLYLQEVARRLPTCVSATDTVARFSGDGFAVLLEDLSQVPEDAAAQARTVGDKILAALSEPFLAAGRVCRSSAGIGITVFGSNPESAHELVQKADIALHQAKLAGRSVIRFFSPALQAAVNTRAALEEDLRRAIAGDQFVLFFQPQVDSSRLVGAEALIRWNHPQRGTLSPSEFIPLAEETGLILPIGAWVVEAACLQIVAWASRPESAAIQVAVNISARQFRKPDFVHQILDILDRTGANPANLKLELTESMLADDLDDLIAQMSVLKSRGIKFSLDDFGTGYSSLSYLKRLPLDQLKIDRAFVRDILSDVASGAIAETIVSLGRAMGLSVIAEGVETLEQRDFLANLGCHVYQGYLISPPVLPQEFESWLRSRSTLASGEGR